MELKEEDFEELQTMCKHLYVGNHHSRILCHEYKGWVDCTYKHCPKIMKPCNGVVRINGEVVAEVTSINTLL